MKFVERKAKDQFKKGDVKKGDVVRFKDSWDTSYHYALIAKLPSDMTARYDDDETVIVTPVDKYAAIILNDYGCLHAGDTYRTAKNIHKLIDVLSDSEIGWEIVEKAKTSREDLTD